MSIDTSNNCILLLLPTLVNLSNISKVIVHLLITLLVACDVIGMGNSGSQSTVPPHVTSGKRPQMPQTANRADVAADDCTECVKDQCSPSSTSIPRISFYSRLLFRNG